MDTINNFIALFGFLWLLWPIFTILPILPFRSFIPDNNFIDAGICLTISFITIITIIYFIIKHKRSKTKKIIYIIITLIVLLPGFTIISQSYINCLFFGAKDELLGLNTKHIGL